MPWRVLDLLACWKGAFGRRCKSIYLEFDFFMHHVGYLETCMFEGNEQSPLELKNDILMLYMIRSLH